MSNLKSADYNSALAWAIDMFDKQSKVLNLMLSENNLFSSELFYLVKPIFILSILLNQLFSSYVFKVTNIPHSKFPHSLNC